MKSNEMKQTGQSSVKQSNGSRRKKIISSSDRYQKTMSGDIPLMRVCRITGTAPSQRVVNKINAITASGLISQKQIALENSLSQTKMSQYMNGALRVKGWKQVDIMLENWTDSWSAQQTSKENNSAVDEQEFVINHIISENDIPTSYISTEVEHVDVNWKDSTCCVEGWPSFVVPELFIETGYYFLYSINPL